jgi:hypothetical protein
MTVLAYLRFREHTAPPAVSEAVAESAACGLAWRAALASPR